MTVLDIIDIIVKAGIFLSNWDILVKLGITGLKGRLAGLTGRLAGLTGERCCLWGSGAVYGEAVLYREGGV